MKDNKLQKTAVVIGERDPRSGDFVVVSGVAEGDSVIRYPAATLKDGQVVAMNTARAPTAPVSVPAGVSEKGK